MHPVKICWHMHVISTPCHEYRSARTSSSPTLAPPMFTLYVLPSEAPVFPVHSQKPTQLLPMKSCPTMSFRSSALPVPCDEDVSQRDFVQI